MEKSRRRKNKLFVVITTIFVSICTLLPILTIGAGATVVNGGDSSAWSPTIPFKAVVFSEVGRAGTRKQMAFSYPSKMIGDSEADKLDISKVDSSYTETLAGKGEAIEKFTVYEDFVYWTQQLQIIPQKAFSHSFSDKYAYVLIDKSKENTESNRAYITKIDFNGNETAGTGALKLFVEYTAEGETIAGYIYWSGQAVGNNSMTGFDIHTQVKSKSVYQRTNNTSIAVGAVDWEAKVYITERAQPNKEIKLLEQANASGVSNTIIELIAPAWQDKHTEERTVNYSPSLTWNNYNNEKLMSGQSAYIKQSFYTTMKFSQLGKTTEILDGMGGEVISEHYNIMISLEATNFFMTAKDFIFIPTIEADVPYRISTFVEVLVPHMHDYGEQEGEYACFSESCQENETFYFEKEPNAEAGATELIPNVFNEMSEADFSSNGGIIYIKRLSVNIRLDIGKAQIDQAENVTPYNPTIWITNYCREIDPSASGWIAKTIGTKDELYGSAIPVYKGDVLVELPEEGFVTWLGNTVSNFFHTEIFFGVSIGDIMWFCLGLAVLFVVLKIFTRG